MYSICTAKQAQSQDPPFGVLTLCLLAYCCVVYHVNTTPLGVVLTLAQHCTIGISILAYDIWFYISHLLLHTKALYPYHKLHHVNSEPTYLDTHIGHPLEGPFQGIGMFVPYIIFEYSFIDTFIIICILNIRGYAHHDKRGIFLVGDHHLIHHKYPNYNYGQYWIDALCGTRKV